MTVTLCTRLNNYRITEYRMCRKCTLWTHVFSLILTDGSQMTIRVKIILTANKSYLSPVVQGCGMSIILIYNVNTTFCMPFGNMRQHNCLNDFETYCRVWRLHVNAESTQIMMFESNSSSRKDLTTLLRKHLLKKLITIDI